MVNTLNRENVRKKLNNLQFSSLFIEDLGWDNANKNNNLAISLENETFNFKYVAQKRGMIVFSLERDLINYNLRKKLEKKISERFYEHIIIYVSNKDTKQHWFWVKRDYKQPDRIRQINYDPSIQTGELLIQKLEQIS